MATKSILKDVRITDRHLGRSLANALESASGRRVSPVQFKRAPHKVERKDIKEFFEKAE